MAWQVIKRIFGNAMPWLLAALLGFAVYQYMRADTLTAERDAAQERVDRELARSAALQSALDWHRKQEVLINRVLSEREDALGAIASDMAAQRQSLNTLERNNAETRDWAAQPVPDSVARWVRQLGADAGADRDDAERAAAPADTAAAANRGNG
ncbi:hypothetical protein R6258_07815 [Halomonas sp. HP20-15]|uniref:hypothetical protein n=1 Tax=Halomonas sp. HP20-15 TaxID=3085901 RepID=UPI0029814527|nr:hypothetical protein [Halomonas sp. HP20-15]MDW5376826.1 hypothetical protein [Halomonas sp. HP20-15]